MVIYCDMYSRPYLELSWGEYSDMYFGASSELTSEGTFELHESVPLPTFGSILEYMLVTVLEYVLRGILGNILPVYQGTSRDPTTEHTVKQPGNVRLCAIWSIRDSILGTLIVRKLRGILGSIL